MMNTTIFIMKENTEIIHQLTTSGANTIVQKHTTLQNVDHTQTIFKIKMKIE